jgi:hypothetical protein
MVEKLMQAYEAAVEAERAARETWDECPHAATEDCEHVRAYAATEAALDAAKAALADSDEEREWILCEDGCDYDTVVASSAEEALEIARDNVDRANYDDGEDAGTMWITASVRCELTGEEGSCRVALEPEEPECTEAAHDWQSPHEILGGCKENPGVWGHGGGVIIREVCMHCGCERVTDTWAQDRETGEQGLHSVSYEPGKYADEIVELGEGGGK